MNQGLYTSNTDEWETPQELFDRLNWIFNFDVDVCATHGNAKCAKYFTKDQDGLSQTWGGYKAWCNPPYGRNIDKWVRKAAETVKDDQSLVVMLLPARVDTGWYHSYIANNPRAHTVFLKGRLRFGGAKWNAPFPSMIVIFV